MPMNKEDAQKFAAEWANAWNRRDIEKLLQLFHEQITFTSSTALSVVGLATVHGKDALRAYWMEALKRIQTLHFKVDRVVWDAKSRELAIIYISEIDGKSKRVSENLTFDKHGLVVSAEVFHGIAY